MAKVIDLTESDGDLVILGRSLVLPSSEVDSQPTPLNGALRFNPTIGKAQIFFAGSWTTLGEGTGDGSGDGSNNHTHSMTQILGLQTALAAKAALVHTHGITDVTGLTTALADKAPLNHSHGISNITGLQVALDGKALLQHTHNVSIKEKISACLPGNPPALFKLVWTASESVTIPAQLSGSYFKVTTPPAATFVITLLKNGITNMGTVSISPGGVVTISVTSSFTIAANETLVFALPARDTALDTISFTVVGNRNPITVA